METKAPVAARQHMMRVKLSKIYVYMLCLRMLPLSVELAPGVHCCPIFMYVIRVPEVMMIQNIAVDQRFANGTQGRLLHWHPAETESKRKALPAYCSDLLVRFCKESALSKTELMPGVLFCQIP